jgi:predicted component of viral defense system (DUF524 family)
MTDTPEHIKQLQLDIWMSKTPEERLYTHLVENEIIYLNWKKGEDARKLDETEEAAKLKI